MMVAIVVFLAILAAAFVWESLFLEKKVRDLDASVAAAVEKLINYQEAQIKTIKGEFKSHKGSVKQYVHHKVASLQQVRKLQDAMDADDKNITLTKTLISKEIQKRIDS